MASSSDREEPSTNVKATMSAYKPATRPAPRYVNPTPSQPAPPSATQGKITGLLSQGKIFPL